MRIRPRMLFFFAVETMSKIGFGVIYPNSYYLHMVVFFQSWLGLLTDGVVISLIIAKVSRPSRLRHTIQVSTLAVINNIIPFNYNISEMSSTDAINVFSFRIMNMRKRQICSPTIHLYLLIKEMGQNNQSNFVTYQLPYELHRQIGRTRGNFSRPHLPLPWTVCHVIDKSSPLYAMDKNDLLEREAEIIVLYEGADELTSKNFQRRWSYLPNEIHWKYKFVEIVHRGTNGVIKAQLNRLSEIIPEDENV